VEKLDGSNLDRGWIEFGRADRFCGVATAMHSSALIDNAVYQFGDLTPAADNPSGIDSA
jgi:hypothetical protein